MVKDKVILLASPQFRDDVRVTFEELADKEQQLREWVNIGKSPCSYWGSMCFYIFHTLYDDNKLQHLEWCKENVGEIFYTEEEAIEIWKFASWFEKLVDDIGREKPDDSYIKHPDWPRVWIGAAEAFKIMQANDEKYDIRASWQIWYMNLSSANQIKLLKQKINEEGLIKQVKKEESDRIMAEFERLKDQLIAEWEVKAERDAYPGMEEGQWPVYNMNTNPPPEKIGCRYNVRHVIPPEQGGVNEWWNIHPSYE